MCQMKPKFGKNQFWGEKPYKIIIYNFSVFILGSITPLECILRKSNTNFVITANAGVAEYIL